MHTTFPAEKQAQRLEEHGETAPAGGAPYTYTVRDSHQKTAQPHGISTPERKRLVEAAHHMRRRYPRDCKFFVAELHGADRRAVSALSRQLKSHIVTEQRRAGFEPYWVEVVECEPRPHANVVAPLPADAAERIGLSPAYEGHVHVQPVTDMAQLTQYLLKETTPQAAFKTGIRRKHGSHALEGGGDRIRVSKALGAALLSEGRISPWTRSYAARATTAAEMVKGAPEAAPAVHEAVSYEADVSGQLNLFDAATAPVVDICARLEAARQERGLSQREVAAVLGVRQPHFSNSVIRRHDRLSATVVRRALQWVRAA